MSTYRELITRSLRLIGAVATTQAPAAHQTTQGLEVMLEVLDSWGASPQMTFSNSLTAFAFTPNVASYTVGPSATWNLTTRPVRIDSAWVRDNSRSPATDILMQELSASAYGDIASKTTTSTTPLYFNYDPSMPYGTITVWPVPTSASYSMVLLTQDNLDQTMTLDTTVSLPPAYKQALVYNLAVCLCPEYGIEPPTSVIVMALAGKHTVTNNNFESEEMEFDSGLSGASNGRLWLI